MGIGALKSVQRTNEDAVPSVPNAKDTHAIVKRIFFNGVVAGADVAVGTTISLCKIPKGAKVQPSRWGNDATFSGAGVTIDIGTADDPNKYASAIDVASLNKTAFANTKALNEGTITTEEEEIFATTAVDVIVATGTYEGYIEYV